jgi:hypothetical protein
MRGLIAAPLIASFLTALTVLSTSARAQDALVLIKNIDHVEHPNLLEKLWKVVDLKQEQVILSSLGWPELKASLRFLDGANVVHFSGADHEDKVVIEAPVGYSICHAYLKDPSVTCSGTLTGEYGVAGESKNKNNDGLQFAIIFPKINPGEKSPLPGKCWLKGTVVMTFVVTSERSKSLTRNWG